MNAGFGTTVRNGSLIIIPVNNNDLQESIINKLINSINKMIINPVKDHLQM